MYGHECLAPVPYLLQRGSQRALELARIADGSTPPSVRSTNFCSPVQAPARSAPFSAPVPQCLAVHGNRCAPNGIPYPVVCDDRQQVEVQRSRGVTAGRRVRHVRTISRGPHNQAFRFSQFDTRCTSTPAEPGRVGGAIEAFAMRQIQLHRRHTQLVDEGSRCRPLRSGSATETVGLSGRRCSARPSARPAALAGNAAPADHAGPLWRCRVMPACPEPVQRFDGDCWRRSDAEVRFE